MQQLSISSKSQVQTSNIGSSFLKFKQSFAKLSRQFVTLNLGIYIDESYAAVGVANSKNSPEIQILLTVPAQISFTPQRIVLDHSAPTPNYFKVFDLIQGNPLKYEIQLGSEFVRLSPEEILAIYLSKLFAEVTRATNGSSEVDNVVFSIPYCISSLGKERLKAALQLLGHTRVRILSSVLTSVIWYAVSEEYFRTQSQPPKLLLVVHGTKSYFSMAIISLTATSITTEGCLASDNVKQFQDPAIAQAHYTLFSSEGNNNADHDPKTLKVLEKLYKSCIKDLLRCLKPGAKIHKVVGITRSKNSTQLRHLLSRTFVDNQIRILNTEGPLAGACFFSSSQMLQILPPNIQILDAIKADLLLFTNSKKWRIRLKGQKFTPGQIITAGISVPKPETDLILQEDFLKQTNSFQVSHYKIGTNPPNHTRKMEASGKVKCTLFVEEDGIFKMCAEFPPGIPHIFERYDSVAEFMRFDVVEVLEKYYQESFNVRKQTAIETIRLLSEVVVGHYETRMKSLDLRRKSREEIKRTHREVKEESLIIFQGRCHKHGIDPSPWNYELELLIDNQFSMLKQTFRNMFRWIEESFGGNNTGEMCYDGNNNKS